MNFCRKLALPLIIFTVSYSAGFISGIKKFFPYTNIHQISLRLQQNIRSLDECQLERLVELPEQFSVIVGHAYGAAGQNNLDGGLSPNLISFLDVSSKKIDSVVFTGDVFEFPSSKKWNELREKYKNLNIEVAPGNHDFVRPDSREAIYASGIKTNYPYSSTIEDIPIIIDDSVSSNWKTTNELLARVDEISNEKEILIARHNIMVSELLPFANSRKWQSALPEVDEFVKDYPNNVKITWLIGDTGGFQHLPRIACYEFKNHRFILNGLGGLESDTVIVVNSNNIYAYTL